MGYFGGLGAGKGWHKYHFLIDLNELNQLLSLEGISLVVTNGRVPVAYIDTPLSEYVEHYSRYLHCLRTDPSLDWTARQGLDISLTTDREMILEQVCTDARFKLLQPTEPVIGLSPLSILFADDRLLVDIMGKNQGYFGLSMTFPKVVSFGGEGHEICHTTERFANFALHERLRTSLATTTGPCTFLSKSRVQRTSIRISKNCKTWVNEHAYLKMNGLTVK